MQDILDCFSASSIICDRTYHLRVYKKCFTGKLMIDWLIKNGHAKTRADGSQLGQIFLQSDWLHHVVDEHDFEDSDGYYYRLMQHETDEVIRKRKSAYSLKDVACKSYLIKNKFSGLKRGYFVVTGSSIFEYTMHTAGYPRKEWSLNDIIEVNCKQPTFWISFRNGNELKFNAETQLIYSEWLHAFHSVGLSDRICYDETHGASSVSVVSRPASFQTTKRESSKQDVVEIAVVGATRTGKTRMICKLCSISDEDTLPTIESVFNTVIEVDGTPAFLRILDTSGCVEYIDFRTSWIQGRDAILIMFNRKEDSLWESMQWGHFVRAYDPYVPIVFTSVASDVPGAEIVHIVASSLAASFVPCCRTNGGDVTPPFVECVRAAKAAAQKICLCDKSRIARAMALSSLDRESCIQYFQLKDSVEIIGGFSCCVMANHTKSSRGRLLVTNEQIFFETLVPSPQHKMSLNVEEIGNVETSKAGKCICITLENNTTVVFVDFLRFEDVIPVFKKWTQST